MSWTIQYILLFYKIESTKTVKVNGTDTVIRTISIEENGKKIDVTLWREMAEEDLKIGQYLSISHCMLNEWQLHKSLNTTRNSKIQVNNIPPLGNNQIKTNFFS